MSRAPTLAWRLPRAAAAAAVTAGLLGGLPWLLARMTGSPLPGGLPGWQQARRFLSSPLSDDAIIRLLADAAWLLWAVFALSLTVELTAAARGRPAPRLPAIAPVQALAAALVGATMLTALHAPRAGARPAPPLHAALASATTVSAPLAPGHPAQPAAATETADGAASSHPGARARPKVYRVREGDDLWDIAGRLLGNPEDWHQIYQLNQGKPQPDGQSLTDPGLIIPGWVLLIPPADDGHPAFPHHSPAPTARHPAPARHGAPAASPAPPPASTPARPPQDAGPSPRTPQPGPRPASHGSAPRREAHPGRVAVRLPSGDLIGTAVAVMVAAALTLAAVQRRRRYRPRPGPPSSLQPEAPPLPDVISALRRAARPPEPQADAADRDADDPYPDLYETRTEPDTGGAGPDASATAPDLDGGPGDAGAGAGPEPARLGPPARPGRRPGAVPLGVRAGGGEADVDLAELGGLGLTGPGAPAAARAILASLLAQAPADDSGLPAVVIPAADAARLLPGADPAAIPGLSVPPTPDAALAELEACLLTAARLSGAGDDLADPDPGPAPGAGGPLVALIAEAGQVPAARLSAILGAAGRRSGVAAVLLGAWPAGATCQVAADGTVTAVTPPDPGLDLARLFTLGAAEAAAIAGVLQEAGARPPASGPGTPASAAGEREPVPAAGPSPGIRYLPAPGAAPHTAVAPAPAPATGAVAEAEPERPDAAPAETEAAETRPAAPDLAEPPAPGGRPASLELLGPLRITAGGREVRGGMRKARELLAFLAVHPDGANGDAIAEALWPEADPGRAAAQRNLALRKARELLRAATGLAEPMWILNAGGRYRLDPALIDTDLQAFSRALEQARNASGDARLAACRRAVALYRGELADGAGWDWAEPYAETARRRALDAWTTIAEILQPADPDQALSALDTALSHDPYNEYLYVRIMRLQAAAGRPEAVRRTLALLESRLTDLGVAPGAQTRQAAAALLGATGPRQPSM